MACIVIGVVGVVVVGVIVVVGVVVVLRRLASLLWLSLYLLWLWLSAFLSLLPLVFSLLVSCTLYLSARLSVFLFLVDGAPGLGIIVLKRLSFGLLLFFFILISFSLPTSKVSLESNLQ